MSEDQQRVGDLRRRKPPQGSKVLTPSLDQPFSASSAELLDSNKIISGVDSNNDIDSSSQSQSSMNEYDSSSLDELDMDFENEPFSLVDNAKIKFQLLKNYFVWSFVKQLAFWFVVIYLQHIGMTVFVFVLQSFVYRELINSVKREEKEARLGWVMKGWFSLIYWYWFLLASAFSYGSILEKHIFIHSKNLKFLKNKYNFNFVLFTSYSLGVVMFVLTLRKRYYKYQFQRFAYCHVLLFFMMQSSLCVSNMFSGMIYFVLPSMLVSMNSAFIRITQILLTGRDNVFNFQLRQRYNQFSYFNSLSRSFSFVVALILTLIFGFLFTNLLLSFPLKHLMISPKQGILPEYGYFSNFDNFSMQGKKYASHNELNAKLFEFRKLSTFLSKNSELKNSIPEFILNVEICEFHEHVFWFAMFASFFSPFAGFFTSSFKKVFRHPVDFNRGPFVDRLDCHIIMSVFVYTYLHARIFDEQILQKIANVEPEAVMRMIETLGEQSRKKIYSNLQKGLLKEGVLK